MKSTCILTDMDFEYNKTELKKNVLKKKMNNVRQEKD